MAHEVTVTLTRDEAVVFLDWLRRFNAGKAGRFEDQAEQRVLWDLEASLESQMVEPFRQDYDQVLAQARARLRDSTD